MLNLLKEILPSLSSHFNRYNSFSDETIKNSFSIPFELFPLKKELFIKLKKKSSADYFCFIDGGNGSIYSSPSLHIEMQKIAFSCYHKNKKLFLIEIPYLVVLEMSNSNKWNGSYYFEKCKLFSNKNNLFSDLISDDIFNSSFKSFFSSKVNSLSSGIFNSSESSLIEIANDIRKSIEFSISKEIIEIFFKKESDSESLVLVQDGSLFDSYELIKPLVKYYSEHNISVLGISKTSNLITSSGLAPAYVLAKLNQVNNPVNNKVLSEWVIPVGKSDINTLLYARFHEKGKYIFRCDLIGSIDIKSVFSSLLLCSNDPIFLGYPYSLIEIDQFARISKFESDYYKNILMHEILKLDFTLNQVSIENDAHSILDSIKF